MARSCAVLLLAVLALLPVAPALRGAEEAPWTARDLAQKVQVVAEPGFAFRYNNGSGPYGASTESLLEHRRAYFPGEKVKLTFRLPREARVAGPLEARAVLGLYDLDGGTRSTISGKRPCAPKEATSRANSAGPCPKRGKARTSWPRGSWTRMARCSRRAARSCSSLPSTLGFSLRPAMSRSIFRLFRLFCAT